MARIQRSAASGVRVRTVVPAKPKALKLIGGQKSLDSLHAQTVAAAKKTAPNRLQLALAVTSRHFVCDTEEDLDAPATANMSVDDRTHIAFDLNEEDGPWAVAMSDSTLAWAVVTADELSSVKLVEDFVSCVFGHLR